MTERKLVPLKDFGGGECSEEFALAFITFGSIATDCEACGRVHYNDTESQLFEEGEYEELLQKHEQDPERYIPHDGCARWGYIFGKQVVYDCPCGYAAYIEELIWPGRFWIMSYLKSRAEEEAKQASDTAKIAQKAKEAIDKT